MTAKQLTVPGFLVVLKTSEYRGSIGTEINPCYSGVDKIPAYPSKYEKESVALDQYVFGDFKDEDSNLIPTLDKAIELLKMFSDSPREYEIIICCEGPNADVLKSVSAEPLGYDVAGIEGDCWSIVDDFCGSDWAIPYQSLLNEHGLFAEKKDAESYYEEYQKTREPDYDLPFTIVFVARVLVPGGKGDKSNY